MKKSEPNKSIEEITEKLEAGVKSVFESEKYREYLAFMAKFHDYSANNSLLIWMQNPHASLVAGYSAWQSKFNRHVKCGEKGIKILAPMPKKFVKKSKDENGNETETEISYTAFRAVTVFDVSQTEGDDLPKLSCDLTSDVERFQEMVEKLKAVAPVHVDFEEIDGSAKGYFSNSEGRIVIRPGMSELQTVKTMVHEIAHSILHNSENGEQKDVSRHTAEVQAESVAFTVCSALGLDTSDYSFGYVAGWSEGQEAKELAASMEIIRKTAKTILDALKAA